MRRFGTQGRVYPYEIHAYHSPHPRVHARSRG